MGDPDGLPAEIVAELPHKSNTKVKLNKSDRMCMLLTYRYTPEGKEMGIIREIKWLFHGKIESNLGGRRRLFWNNSKAVLCRADSDSTPF